MSNAPSRTPGPLVLTACMLAAFAGPGLQAAPINYGDFSDIPPGSVMYADVTESSSNVPDPLPQYGEPTAIGDRLDFDPTGFGATSAGASPGAATREGQLNFGFSTVSGTGLSGLAIAEDGDYSLQGTGTTTTSVSAGLFVRVEISHINGSALGSNIVITGSSLFSTNLISTPGLGAWNNNLYVDFATALTNAGYDPEADFATEGEVVVNNILSAFSQDGTSAQVVKKEFSVLPTVEAVPEPSSLALLTLGAALMSRRRR